MIDPLKTKEIFDRLSVVMAGEPINEGGAALMEMLCGMMCITSATKDEALERIENLVQDMRMLIDAKFDWHHRTAVPVVRTVSETRN